MISISNAGGAIADGLSLKLQQTGRTELRRGTLSVYQDNVASPSFDKAWVEVTYPTRRVITGYKIKSQDWGGAVPKAWRLYGRDAGGEWELLDQQTAATVEPNYHWSDEFVVDCGIHPGRLSCPAISLAKGTTLSAFANTELVCQSIVDNGATYDFAAGSSVSLNTASDLTVDNAVGGAFVKTGSGTLESYGTPSVDSLRVSGGTLALRTPVALKQWKLAIGDVYNLSGGEVTFGELAVNDTAGNRLNVNGSPTMVSYDEGSFKGGQAMNLYDNNGGTQGWVSSDGLVPSNESTWKTTLFTLTETAPAVASYNLETASYGAPANGTPKTWKLYARASSSDAWTLIDAQTDVTTPSASYTWYRNGVPWRLAATAGSVAAFGATTPVTVDAGATLDVSCAAETAIGHLVVDGDAASAGTICGGSFAAEGVLEVSFADASRKPPFALPLVCADVDGVANLKMWTVICNGKTLNAKLLRSPDGSLRVEPQGLVLIFR